MSDSNPSTHLLKKRKEEYQAMSQHLSPIPSNISSISNNDAKATTSTPLSSDVESGKEGDDMKNLSSAEQFSAGYNSMEEKGSGQYTAYQSDEDLTTGICNL